ncbi:MAG: hypothetical protein ACRCZN_05905 [Lactococcus lactis]
MNFETFLPSILTTLFSTSTLGLFINWRITASQKKQDIGITISDELLKKVFYKHYFELFNDSHIKIEKTTNKEVIIQHFQSIITEQEKFRSTIELERLSAYIYELKKDSIVMSRLLQNIVSNLINEEDDSFYQRYKREIKEGIEYYDSFVIRYEEALRRYRKNVGSITSPEQTRAARNSRFIAFMSMTFIPIIVVYFLSHNITQNFLFSIIEFCSVLLFIIGIIILYILMIGDIIYTIRYSRSFGNFLRFIKKHLKKILIAALLILIIIVIGIKVSIFHK